MAFYFFKKRWFVACLFLLQKFAKFAIIASCLFQKTACKPQQTFKTLALIYGYFAKGSVWQKALTLSFWAFCKKAKNPHFKFMDTSLSCESSVWQGFCHFERSALAQSEKSTEIKSALTIFGYFAFLRKLSMTIL